MDCLGIVLVYVATCDLEGTLPEQRLQRVPDRTMAPVWDMDGKRRTETQGSVGFREPAEGAWS